MGVNRVTVTRLELWRGETTHKWTPGVRTTSVRSTGLPTRNCIRTRRRRVRDLSLTDVLSKLEWVACGQRDERVVADMRVLPPCVSLGRGRGKGKTDHEASLRPDIARALTYL